MVNHNAFWHDGGKRSQIVLDIAWGKNIPNRLFSCLIVCTVVNTYLEMTYFLKTDETLMEFS